MIIKKSQINKICKKLKSDPIDFSFLSRGEHNESYIINTTQGKFVLRIENNLQFKNLKNEYKFLNKINGKFAPKVYLFDNSKKIIPRDYLVQEFIKGKHPKRRINNDFIKTMALWYKKLHSIKSSGVKPLKKRGYYSVYDDFKPYLRKFNKLKTILNENMIKQLSQLFYKCNHIFSKYDKAFSRRKNLSLNHGDPTRSNVFYDRGEVRLIDWEFVRYDLKEKDLVFFEYSYDLTRKQRDLFLKTYGYPNSDVAKRKMQIVILRHYIGMIMWRIERLNLLYKGKVDMRQSSSDERKMIREIREDLKSANKIINKIS